MASPFNPVNISPESVAFLSKKNPSTWLFRISFGGIIIGLIGFWVDRQQFYFSYLLGFSYVMSFMLAALLMIMIHHICKAQWGKVFLRLSESMVSRFFIWIVFLVPILFGIHDLYHWSHIDAVESDPILAGKTGYLNDNFFIFRQLLYFTLWSFFGYRLHELSIQSDYSQGLVNSLSMRKISALGIVIIAFTIAFSSFDWLMSLDPHWFSTMFGVYFFAMSFQALFPLLIILAWIIRRYKMIKSGIISNARIGDLGLWFFAFTVFYAYIAFCQYMLIYYANLPEETLWFYHRMDHGWEILLILFLLGRFLLPFLLLINSDAKRNIKILVPVSFLVLVLHFAELYWIIMPNFKPTGVLPSWMDIVLPLGLFCMFLALFFHKYAQSSLVPLRFQHSPMSYTNKSELPS